MKIITKVLTFSILFSLVSISHHTVSAFFPSDITIYEDRKILTFDDFDDNLPDGYQITSKDLYFDDTDTPIGTFEVPSKVYKGDIFAAKFTFHGHSDIKEIIDVNSWEEIVFEDSPILPGEDKYIYFDSSNGYFNSYDTIVLKDYIALSTSDEEWSVDSYEDFPIEVVDPLDYPPTFNGSDTFYSNTANPLSITEIISNLSVHDYRGTDITDAITVIGDNFSQNRESAGEWQVVLEVEDENALVSEFQITVISEAFEKPQITLNGESSITLNVDDQYIEHGALGFLNDGQTLESNISGSVNTNVPGTYTLEYNVEDDSGNRSETLIRTVYVNDGVPPIINMIGEETIDVEYEEDFIDPGAEATDNYDENLSISISGSVDTNNLGLYQLRYNAMDSSGNRAETITRTIYVVDTTPPELTVENQTFESESLPSTDQILSQFSSMDNHDGDLSTSIEVIESEYSKTITLPGEYKMVLKSVDSSNNIATETIWITVADTTPPEIIGPSNIIKNIDYITNSTFFLDYYDIDDNFDGNSDLEMEIIKNEYSGNANNEGVYGIEIIVRDSSGNTTQKKITISVIEDVPWLLLIDNEKIVVSHNIQLTNNLLVESFKTADIVPNNSFLFETSSDDYTSNFDVLGEHNYTFNLLSETGEDYSFDLEMNVIDESSQVHESTPSFLTNCVAWLKNRWWLTIIPVIAIIGILNKNK